MRDGKENSTRLQRVTQVAKDLTRFEKVIEDVYHHRDRHAPSWNIGGAVLSVPYRDVVRSQSTRQLLVNLMVGLVEPEAVEGASPRNELREEADVAADLKIFPREPAVRGHELRVLVLSAH